MSAYDTVLREHETWVRAYCEADEGLSEFEVLLDIGCGQRNYSPEAAERVGNALIEAARRARLKTAPGKEG